MPHVNGYDLCARIRDLPSNRRTPVLFLTGTYNLETRTRTRLSGGTDIVAKPFAHLELAVKGLTHVLKRRMLKGEQADPGANN